MKKPLPPSYFLGAIGFAGLLHVVLPGYRLLAFPWRLTGLLPLAIGVALNLAADQAFKRYHTAVKPFEVSKALITSGVFRISRNPMYLGMVLIALGIAMLLATATPFLAVVALGVLLDRLFIVAEERLLNQQFGDEFRDYKQRVRRWV